VTSLSKPFLAIAPANGFATYPGPGFQSEINNLILSSKPFGMGIENDCAILENKRIPIPPTPNFNKLVNSKKKLNLRRNLP